MPKFEVITESNLLLLHGKKFASSFRKYNLSVDDEWFIHIKVGVNRIFLAVTLTTIGASTVEFYGESEILVDGTLLKIHNCNRKFKDIKFPTTKIYSNPTITDLGNMFDSDCIGNISGNVKTGGQFVLPEDWELLPNSSYVLKFISRSDQNISTIRIRIYEPDLA